MRLPHDWSSSEHLYLMGISKARLLRESLDNHDEELHVDFSCTYFSQLTFSKSNIKIKFCKRVDHFQHQWCTPIFVGNKISYISSHRNKILYGIKLIYHVQDTNCIPSLNLRFTFTYETIYFANDKKKLETFENLVCSINLTRSTKPNFCVFQIGQYKICSWITSSELSIRNAILFFF